ncbi:MAG: hypothetical protein ACI9MR_002641 [Myxococcota bacterium]
MLITAIAVSAIGGCEDTQPSDPDVGDTITVDSEDSAVEDSTLDVDETSASAFRVEPDDGQEDNGAGAAPKVVPDDWNPVWGAQ